MVRITHNYILSQGVDDDGPLSPDRDALFFQDYHDSVYSELTAPQKIIAVSRYFLDHWLPVLGPSPAWLIIAIRQAAFVYHSTKEEVVRSLSVRSLTRWSGLSHGQIWNIMQKEPFLGWFVRKLSQPQSKRESDIWEVQTTIPVAPQHIMCLENFILGLRQERPEISRKELLSILRTDSSALIKNAPKIPTDLPAKRFSLREILEAHFGAFDSEDTLVYEEILGRITQPGNTIAITHYFIDHWRPQLTSGEAWLVHVLRSHVYSSSQNTSRTNVNGGKVRLAEMLGVNVRSMRRWFSDLPVSSLKYFLSANQKGETAPLSLDINMRDPVCPDDLVRYKEMLHKSRETAADTDGQNWTHNKASSRAQQDKNGHQQTPKDDEERTIIDEDPDKNGHHEGQNLTLPRTTVDTLIGFNLIDNKNLMIQPQQTEPLGLLGQEGGWLAINLLDHSGLPTAKKANICAQMTRQPEKLRKFLGWLLYGYENRGQAGSGISSPILFALSRYEQSQPADKYLALAQESPRNLLRLMQNRFSPGVSPLWRPILDALEVNGFAEILQTQGCTAVAPQERTYSLAEARGEEHPISDTNNTLFPKSPANTLSAETCWQGMRELAQIPEKFAPVAIWLNHNQLELTFLHKENTHAVHRAITQNLYILAEHFPWCSLRLCTLQVTSPSSNQAPALETLSEVIVNFSKIHPLQISTVLMETEKVH